MSSPFKFLDPFEKQDKATFFGRDAEVEQLYRLLFEGNLVLVYGASGTGKTSLIQCGLANRFAETDWFQLFVRRGDEINAALDREIRTRADTPIPPDADVVAAIRSLYLDHLRPVYLIFDQFEELFILGTKAEQERFFATAASILASDVSCKIIISLREEYLAALQRFEEVVPSLFNKRLRVEPMSTLNVEQVITGTCGALGIGLEHGADTARLIIAQLNDERVGVQLAYLQVYLDTLYNRTAAASGSGAILFTDAAVQATGRLGDIMAGFLDEQTARLQALLAARFPALPANAVAHLLEEFVTVDGTKQPVSRDELLARIAGIEAWLDPALSGLQDARILRKVEDRFELAHDSLAGRIADRRSGERKAMMIVEKIVRDRIAAFPQTRTWLNAEELAVVSRAGRQSGAIGGSQPLELSPAESAFVRKSIWKRRWRRFRFVGGIVLLILLCLIVGGIMFSNDQDDEAVAETNATDYGLYGAYRELIGQSDPTSAKVRTRLVQAEAALNQKHEEVVAADLDSEADDFWLQLGRADLAFEAGDRMKAKAGYLALERDWRSRLTDENLRARVRLKAIRWRLYTTGLGSGAVADLGEILALAVPPVADHSVVSFADDIRSACFQLFLMSRRDPRCAREKFKPVADAGPTTLYPG